MTRRKITPDHLDHLELDERGRIYWQGEPIVTDSRLALTKWQNVFGVAIGISAVLGGVGSFAQGLVVLLQYWSGPPAP